MTTQEKKFLRKFIKPYSGSYVLYSFLVVLATIFSIASILSLNNFLQILFATSSAKTPSLLGDLLNSVYGFFLAMGKSKALIYFTLLILFVYLLKDLFSWVAQSQIGSTRNLIIRDIRSALFDKFSSQDVSYISKFQKGDLLSRFSSDILELEETVLKAIQTMINSIVVVFMYLVMLFYIDPFLTMVALILFPLVAILTSMLSRKLRHSSRRLQDHNANLVARIEETIGGIRIIKALQAIDYVNAKFQLFNEKYTLLRNKVYRRVDLASPQSEFFSSIVVSFLLLLGSYKIFYGTHLSSTMFVVYLILFILIIKPAKDASTAYYNLKRGTAAMNRILEVVDSENEIKEPENLIKFPKLQKGITFKNVSFAYTNNNEVLQDINIVFEKGKTTAIVGSSGSGKTTIIDLIEKFYQLQPDSGEIYFDDVPISSLTGCEVRKHIALVAQDTVLVNDTVANNIAFGGEYTYKQIFDAALKANAVEFIEQLPEKMQTNIGDKGEKLSGGQKQRISIARAVLKHAPILILDEATSALDTESERKVQNALDMISKNHTTIVVAHRLSTIKNADKIIVLDNGKVREQGTHEELYRNKDMYYNLYQMQQI